ncbi:luciferase family protein [Parvibaculum lavamentivorans DS-1]|uniref:Luciferase family protein n=1 Tax=Parvibaculum lavamentivorans (strain DS-1 / DSM 13023 / NCIMB 13966) TaxID=402881 RepID=A7HRT1_PARL1|nr:LLM class flavin-dependent oxidoreductase [Parvibaculum lavamentivorans]ABS62614.1 luciferase family protein [Parvibaculum lavamentivorans DS-1]
MSSSNDKKEFGVFLPIANGGWIISKNTPPLDASYKQNREAAMIADEIGLDFIMSMMKWRGFGGDTEHWGTSLESITMMAGIAEATKNARIIATVHTLLQNPAVVAKMITTLDHISGGRAGLNIVSGAFKDEFDQMGAWPADLDHDGRYRYAEEWTKLVRTMWEKDHVDHDGEFFKFKDCVSEPKPMSSPRPYLICAGQSERGLRFTVQNTDACFIGGKTAEDTLRISRLARRVAAEYDTTIRVFAMSTIVFGETDEEAAETVSYYKQGLDWGAVQGMMRSYGMEADGSSSVMGEKAKETFMTHTVAGTPATCLEKLKEQIEGCELDGIMTIYPDYVKGLTIFGKEVLPGLKAHFA